MQLTREERVRIASFLYKLAIRTQKASARPVDTGRALMAINNASNKALSKLLTYFTPSGQGKKPPTLAKCLANKTFVPGQGEGVRVTMFLGPFHLVESADGSLQVWNSKTEVDSMSAGGLSGLVPLEKLEHVIGVQLGGVSGRIGVVMADVRQGEDRKYRIERGFGTITRGGQSTQTRVWKIIDNATGKVALFEDPNVVSQIEKDPAKSGNLDPYRPAVFGSAEEAAHVLNQLTRGISTKSRVIPKFSERLVYLKYSAAYLHDTVMFKFFDHLLADEPTQQTATPASPKSSIWEDTEGESFMLGKPLWKETLNKPKKKEAV